MSAYSRVSRVSSLRGNSAEIIQEFEDELNRIFSVYLDADHGFTEISKIMASLKNPDDYEIRYGTDDDTLSARSMKQIIADNCSDGYNRPLPSTRLHCYRLPTLG